MSTLDATTTRQALLKKGFKTKDGSHHFYLYYYEGKLVAKTMVSHNDQEIGKKLISKMYKQCCVTKDEFLDLISCTLDEKGYIEALKKNGTIQSQTGGSAK
jgi:predicted RNA binding protein YcfA (HicA-like mRNA interferase family)